MSIGIVGNDRKIVSLFPPGPALGRLTNAVLSAVSKSFAEQSMRDPTRDEVKRRVNICMDKAIILRGEMEWGLDRICDTLPEILRSVLVTGKWEPPANARQCWVPSDGSV